jgi:type IX secretion system PorP/SprF family membrane protein
MKRIIYFLLLISTGQIAVAQQLPLLSQYTYNKFLINPAQAGSDGYTSINLTAREQWVGYNGAPRTYTLSWQTRLLKRGYKLNKNIFNKTVYRAKTEGNVGWGGYVFSDRSGLVYRTGFQTTYSYHTWLQDYTQLSFGLAFTGYHYIITANSSSFEQANEPWLNNNLRRGVLIPDVDFGIYIVNPHFDVGFSGQQLLGAIGKVKLGDYAYNNYLMDRHYYLFGSYSFETGVHTILEPSLLIKMSEQVRPQATIGFTYDYDEAIWASIGYRTAGWLTASFRMKYVNSNVELMAMYFGYAYDYSLTKIQGATYGTHELIVAVKFGDRKKRFRWIDRF